MNHDTGITAFDHADIYRYSTSGAVFGEVLSRAPGLSARITLQTKAGIRLPEEGGPGLCDLRGPSVLRRVGESLARPRTDAVDVLLLRRPAPLAGPEELAEALTSPHRQGLVRRSGVSDTHAAQIARLRSFLDVPLTVDQLEMSPHPQELGGGGGAVVAPASPGRDRAGGRGVPAGADPRLP
ncbi:aldo/keto reductase [Streptomyces sp. NPDC057242]|uniref:aldo/keto reductase n=1 Tax=unclassified Streptomyces TaxID=2593676 RepID=UPI003626122E